MAQPGMRELPFQYQQRGPELAVASAEDTVKYGRFIESRDQDLENYLAGLHGLPPGGTDGQVLAKASDADYDVEWVPAQGFSNDFFRFQGSFLGADLTSGAFTRTDSVGGDSFIFSTIEMQTTGLGVTLDVRGNPVIPAGVWHLEFAISIDFDVLGTGNFVYEPAVGGGVYIEAGIAQPIHTFDAFSGGGGYFVYANSSLIVRRTVPAAIESYFNNMTSENVDNGATVYIAGTRLTAVGTVS